MVCIASTDGYFKKINAEWEAVLGYTEAELLAIPFAELIHPVDRAATWLEVERQIGGAETIHFINRYRTKDGLYRWFDWNASPSPDGTLLFAGLRETSANGKPPKKNCNRRITNWKNGSGSAALTPDAMIS